MKYSQLKIAQRRCQQICQRVSPPVPALAMGLRTGFLSPRVPASNTRSRSAITSIDIIVSTVLLGAVLSTATSLCFRINQIWKGISHQRVATQELANQLEGLTRLNVEEIQSAIENLQASELCTRSLHDPKLSGEITEDELGMRVTLQIRWEASPKPLQAELAGWLIDPQAVVEDAKKPTKNPQKDTAEPKASIESNGSRTLTSEGL